MASAVGAGRDPGLERERMIRDEVRALQLIAVRVMSWGVTVLVSVQTALFFVRREVALSNVNGGAGGNASGDALMTVPLNRYLLGTFFLTLLATIFFRLFLYVSTRLRYYRKQLENCPSGISEMPIRKGVRFWTGCVFYVFPLVDILARAYLHIGLK
jgi:hypothetical protein